MNGLRKKRNNLRIKEAQAPIAPIALIKRYPLSEQDINTIDYARDMIVDILSGKDERLMVIIGPCSVHDYQATLEYAQKLAQAQAKFKSELFIVMRVYFEKPRTTIGWKGLIYDPDLDESFDMDKGLEQARSLLREIVRLELATATEYLDLITPQYFTDLISWGAIGARTTESQIHRELASGLSCPVGFKNATDGNIDVAIDAIVSASHPHMFWSISKKGKLKRYKTLGNPNCHIILRGGRTPNYAQNFVVEACQKLASLNLTPSLMVDCSHGNSGKQFKNQLKVVDNIATQIASGSHHIFGVMIESYLVEGRQNINKRKNLVYGQSITDACLGWDDSTQALATLAQAVRTRQESKAISAS